MKSKTKRLEGTQGAPQKLTLKKKKTMMSSKMNQITKIDDQEEWQW